jgi:hypothetical protein
MITPTALLLPALAAAVLVFLASSIIHMFTPWHAGDFSRLPDEDAVLSALRPFNLAPGAYAAPRPKDMKDMGSPEYKQKSERGPVVMLTVMRNGQTGMGQQLVLWFVYTVAISFFAGWVTSKAAGMATDRTIVFKFVAAIAFGAYTMGLWQMAIWYRRSWLVTFKSTIDGLLYALLTAAAFTWLWPS